MDECAEWGQGGWEPWLNCPGLKFLVLKALQRAVTQAEPLWCRSGSRLTLTDSKRARMAGLDWDSSSIRRLNDSGWPVQYGSAIALQLTSSGQISSGQISSGQISTLQLADHLATALATTFQGMTTKAKGLIPEFSLEKVPEGKSTDGECGRLGDLRESGGSGVWVRVIPPGRIVLELTAGEMVQWLTVWSHWLRHDSWLDGVGCFLGSGLWGEEPMILHYAHARCCALLRLTGMGVEVGGSWEDGQGAEERFLGAQPRGWALLMERYPTVPNWVGALVDVLDGGCDLVRRGQEPAMGQQFGQQFGQQRGQQLGRVFWQRSLALARAFDGVYREGAPWCEVPEGDRPLLLAKLGLVRLTQGVLQGVLEKGLGCAALRSL